MGLFTRKSKWDHLMEAAAAALASAGFRKASKVTLGVVGGAVAATAASAAVSAARHQDES
jgi:uncharacterized protein (DUF697 family)